MRKVSVRTVIPKENGKVKLHADSL